MTFTAICLNVACPRRSSPMPTRAAAEWWISTHATYQHPGDKPTGRIEAHEEPAVDEGGEG